MTLERGKVAKAYSIDKVRALTREELVLLQARRTKPVVQRLRDPHHALARLLAAGVRHLEAGQRTGYSYNRVSTLLQDPTFIELVEYYRKLVTASFVESIDDYAQLATANMLKAERMIADKLEDAEDGDALPTRDLIAISRDAADRFGYGKKQTNLNVNVDFAAQLEKAIRRSGKQIEGTATTAVIASTQLPAQLPTRSLHPEPLRRRA